MWYALPDVDAWHVLHSWAPIPISKPCKIHSLRYSNSPYDFLMELQAWKLVTLDLKTKQPEPVEVFSVKHFSRVSCKNIPTWHFHQWESGFHGILHLCKSPPPATSAGEMLVNQQVSNIRNRLFVPCQSFFWVWRHLNQVLRNSCAMLFNAKSFGFPQEQCFRAEFSAAVN